MNIEITTSETLDSNIEIVRYPGQAAKKLTSIANMHKSKKRKIKHSKTTLRSILLDKGPHGPVEEGRQHAKKGT